MYLLVWGKNQCKALACISALVAVTNTVELIHGSEIEIERFPSFDRIRNAMLLRHLQYTKQAVDRVLKPSSKLYAQD